MRTTATELLSLLSLKQSSRSASEFPGLKIPFKLIDIVFYQGCGSGSGESGPFSVEAEAEARKFHHFRFHIGGKNGGRKEISSAILRRRTNRGSINIKK